MVEARCKNINCNKKKEISEMFNFKIPIRRENGEIMFGSFNGIYFCDTDCWLVYNKVVDDVKIIKKLRCKSKPTCDVCFFNVWHLPVIYNHKPTCNQIYVRQVMEEGKMVKKCTECGVIESITDCSEMVIEKKSKTEKFELPLDPNEEEKEMEGDEKEEMTKNEIFDV